MLKRRGRTLRNAERPSSGCEMLVMPGDIATSTPPERVKTLVFSSREATRSHGAGDFMVAPAGGKGVGGLVRAATRQQSVVFDLCGEVDGEVGVGVAPEIEKGLIGADCRPCIAHRTLGSGELEPGERSDDPSSDQAAPEQHLLKLGRGCTGITGLQIRQASNVRRVERLEDE